MPRKTLQTSSGVPAAATVAVAVKGSVGEATGGGGSRRAIRWAVENLLPTADRFVLVHVMPPVTSIPTPTGERIPVDGLDGNVVAMYVRDMKKELDQIFVPFKRLCKTSKVETLLLEHDDPATALLKYISDSGVNSLVMGSFSSSFLSRKIKVQDVPSAVLRHAPETCEVYVVCKERIIAKSVDHVFAGEATASSRISSTQGIVHGGLVETGSKPPIVAKKACKEALNAINVDRSELSIGSPTTWKPFGISTLSQHSYVVSQAFTDTHSSTDVSVVEERNRMNLRNSTKTDTNKQFEPVTSVKTQKSDVKAEVERLRKEVQTTFAMYKQACGELVQKQTKVQLLSSECLEEARRVTAALEKEETLRKAAAEEKEKHLQAMKEVEEAKALLAKEFSERQLAELNALKQCIEKRKIIDQLFSSDRRYRKYTRDEIEAATDYFSPSNVIGEGGYGKVYKCSLDHTPVAVKVLKPDSREKKEEFLKEVSVLSQLRHPHVVLLLGACPENGCLVYEFLENGSLEEYISLRNGKPPLPWFIRFRIIFEIACGLAFLHNSKPEPIVHRDLKPGNILLDRNYVSKIGDVGLAKLVSDGVPDGVTVYKNSVLAGTLYYMDPEYQRTGTIRPKSDLYAFGVIILQLLTARHPNGLLFCVEDAIKRGCFLEMLDGSVKDWPRAEAEELARIALKCSQLRCRDRPDLDNEVLPVLKQILESVNAKIKIEGDNLRPPSHYFCPIIMEIMKDPQIAADGFTYEHRAIEAWIAKHNVSPVTKQTLQHLDLTPNHTLRYAIQEWRSRMELPSALIDKND